MISPLLLILATLPGLFVCYVIFRIDKYDREPPVQLALSFVLGMAVTFPAVSLEKMVFPWFHIPEASWYQTLMLAMIPVAGSEESLKFLALLCWPYPRRFFNEPLDGIVYAIMIGMGFAAVENLLYGYRFGMETIFIRVFTAVPAHLSFAVIQGYFVGLAKFNPHNRYRLLLKGFLFSVGVHGAYDFLILHHRPEWLPVLGSVALYLCLFYCNSLVREHLENSPFKDP